MLQQPRFLRRRDWTEPGQWGDWLPEWYLMQTRFLSQRDPRRVPPQVQTRHCGHSHCVPSRLKRRKRRLSLRRRRCCQRPMGLLLLLGQERREPQMDLSRRSRKGRLPLQKEQQTKRPEKRLPSLSLPQQVHLQQRQSQRLLPPSRHPTVKHSK